MVQGSNGVIYSANGQGQGPSGLIAFVLGAGNNSLVPKGEVDVDTDPLPSGPSECNHDPTPPSIDFSNVQWQRTTPALNASQSHLFVGNREAALGDLRNRIQAFRTVDPSQSSTNLAATSLDACYADDDGFTAPVAYARVPCAGCCGATSTQIDRLFVGEREDGGFHAIDFCVPPIGETVTFCGQSITSATPKFCAKYQIQLSTPVHQFRARGAVALELGTVYVYDEAGDREVMYALDVDTGDKRWEYDVGDTLYGGSAQCLNAGTPAGGKNCYPGPIPYVIDFDPSPPAGSNGKFAVGSDGCWDEPQLLFVVGAHALPQPTPDLKFIGTSIDSGAPGFRTQTGVDLVNFSSGKQIHLGCFYFCGGVIDLDPGLNEIAVKTYDKAGKEGNTRLRIEYDPINHCT